MKAWSYSSLTKYDTCPRQYYEIKVAKNYQEEQGDQAIWGVDVHKAIELNFTEEKPLPERMKAFQPQIQKVKDSVLNSGGEWAVELELGVDTTFTEARAFADEENCHARGIIDLICIRGNVALNLDWKTGKIKDSNQLRMSSGLIFANFLQVDTVHAGYIWLADKVTSKETWRRTDDIWSVFLPTLRDLQWSFENNVWPARPSGLCRGWCSVKSCEYWQPKRVKR